MRYFSEKTIATLQKEYNQYRSVQFIGIKENPQLFKQELLLLQSYNILQLAPSDIELVQWNTITPVKDTSEVKVLNVGDITALTTQNKTLSNITKTTPGNYVFIPSLQTFGIYTKDTNKIVVNNTIVIKEPYLNRVLPELQYVKQTAITKVIPNLLTKRTEILKTAAVSRKARGFTILPKKGDKFKIRAYASMKKEFGEEVSSIQMENEEGNLEPFEVRYILPSSHLYGTPFIKICKSLCNVEGTITSYDKTTGIIKATYIINGKEVSSITSIIDGEEILELEEPLVIHEQHIVKI